MKKLLIFLGRLTAIIIVIAINAALVRFIIYMIYG